MRLADLSWPEVERCASDTLLAIPLGSTEQHGPHLRLSTDTDIAMHLADGLARARPDVWVAPAVPYGSSGEHAGFPGTLSIGQAGLELVVVELVRSALAFAGVVVVNAHGGNDEPLGRALATLRSEGRRVLAWSPRSAFPAPVGPAAAPRVPARRGRALLPPDAHAGRTETSLLLALAPSSVRVEAAEPGNRVCLHALATELRAGGVLAVSPNGVLGDPMRATAAEGRILVAAFIADLVAAVDAWARVPTA